MKLKDETPTLSFGYGRMEKGEGQGKYVTFPNMMHKEDDHL